MNIIESREKLKDISDNDVVNYYHNPTPDVPMFLSLSELQRRKRVRDSYQANKPEEKSVAEELIEEAQPQMAGVAGLPEAQPMMQAMAPQPEMPMEQMAQGGLAELDTGDMFDEQSYAGGGIVAFAKGGTPDQYGVTMPIVPTMDDLIMQTQESQRAFGVDPDFYKKILDESEKERIKDLSEAKKMDQAQLLLAMGSAFAGTPFFGQALAKAGERAVPIIGSMNRNQREINNMYRMADRKALEAQNAQNRGDAQAAQKAIVDRENLLLNAQIEEAKVGATIARTFASNKRDLYNKARDNAQNAMRDQYKDGLAAAPFFGDEAKWNAELDRKINKEVAFLASEYNVDPSEIKPISSSLTSTSTTAKPADKSTTAKPADKSTTAEKPKPTQADIDYVTAHPELRDRFKARFGIDAPSLVNQIPR